MSLDLRLDFLARRRWPVAGSALLALGLALLVWQGLPVLTEYDSLQRQRDGLAALQRGAKLPRLPAVSAEGQARHAAIDKLAGYLATPWDPLLTLFESKAGAQVVLLRFEPNAAEGRLEVSGRASSTAALSGYLITLEQDPRLQDVMLRHHEVTAGSSGGQVDFTLAAVWGAGAVARPPLTDNAAAVPPRRIAAP